MIRRSEPTPPKKHRKTPLSPAVASRASVVIALMEMGLSDYDKIADAVGLTSADIRRIDMAEDAKIRRLATQGTPEGTYYTLRRPIRCPGCDGKVTLVPCVVCQIRRASAD